MPAMAVASAVSARICSSCSATVPKVKPDGSWIIMIAPIAMTISSPAMAMTEAAEAAIPLDDDGLAPGVRDERGVDRRALGGDAAAAVQPDRHVLPAADAGQRKDDVGSAEAVVPIEVADRAAEHDLVPRDQYGHGGSCQSEVRAASSALLSELCCPPSASSALAMDAGAPPFAAGRRPSLV